MSLDAAVGKNGGAALVGTVTDMTGALIPDATINLTDSEMRIAHTVTTDSAGHYRATGLAPGSYDLDATARGFANLHVGKVAVSASKENVLNLSLQVAAMSETVTVESEGQAIELKSTPVPEDKRIAASIPIAVFEMVTDKGVHWTSADGLTWRKK
jgi:uncharacterized surface anchored protein